MHHFLYAQKLRTNIYQRNKELNYQGLFTATDMARDSLL